MPVIISKWKILFYKIFLLLISFFFFLYSAKAQVKFKQQKKDSILRAYQNQPIEDLTELRVSKKASKEKNGKVSESLDKTILFKTEPDSFRVLKNIQENKLLEMQLIGNLKTHLIKENQDQLSDQLEETEIDRQILNHYHEIRFNRNISIFFGILSFVLFGAAMLVFHINRKTIRLNKIISEQKAELEKLNTVKDKIFSVVSHDMRTPINSLVSLIQLFEEGQVDQQTLTKYAGLLKKTLSYTSVMMENLLSWASSQMQGFKPAIEEFDVKICINDVVNSMSTLAVQKEIIIEQEMSLNMLCLGDVNMTTVVLRNLIGNAIKFSPNKCKITISTIQQAHELKISVTDNGIGIPKDKLKDFNDNSLLGATKITLGTNKEKGTGIGLMLCKTFTKMMNGSLHVVSVEGQGSIFTLGLPKA